MGVLGSNGSPQHFDRRRPSWVLRKMQASQRPQSMLEDKIEDKKWNLEDIRGHFEQNRGHLEDIFKNF